MNKPAKLKIIMLSADFSLPPYGGIAAHLAGLCTALKELGHEITIAVPDYGKGEHREVYQGMEIVRMRGGSGPRFIRYALRLLALRKALRNLVREKGADLVHVHDLLVGPPIARAVQGRVPFVFTNHTSVYARWSEKKRFRLLLRLLVGRPDGIITVSPILKDRSAIHRPLAIELIPSGVDTDRFHPLPKQGEVMKTLKLSEGDPVILYVGRFAPVKGLPYLIGATAKIRESIPNIKLLLAGGGNREEEAAVKEAITDANLENNVLMPGPVPYDLLPGYYSVADVVALPSLMEATSIAGLEAMASGKPVVGTDVGGLPLIIDRCVTGMIVPPRNPEALASALRDLITDAAIRERMARSARLRAEKLFSWRLIAERTTAFYHRVLETRRGGADR